MSRRSSALVAPGLGPGGSDEWLQIGLSGFAGGVSSVYYEVARPGRAPLYTELKTDVRPGETHRIAVLEQHGRAGWWRVWLDGRAASRPIYLPGSHGRWTPMATAESWTPAGRPATPTRSVSAGSALRRRRGLAGSLFATTTRSAMPAIASSAARIGIRRDDCAGCAVEQAARQRQGMIVIGVPGRT